LTDPALENLPRVLIVYYSQSGDVRRATEALVQPLAACGARLHWEELRPQTPYPFPWRNIHRFFYIMPDCVLGHPSPIAPLSPAAWEDYDLVILAWQVWFLSPSLPVQALLRSPDGERLLKNRNVITVCVSRNMWHSASETMKGLLREAGARHVDNVVVTHQGPPLATFVTTTRRLLTGRSGKVLGVLPSAEVGHHDFARLNRLGQALASQGDRLTARESASFLRGLDAVHVNRRYVIPERMARGVFWGWAKALDASGRVWTGFRHFGTFLFGNFLLTMILTGIPLVFLGQWLLSPLLRGWLTKYVAQLEAPTGGPASDWSSTRK
jgi:hypothetical protein